jgi:hypothetical protein
MGPVLTRDKTIADLIEILGKAIVWSQQVPGATTEYEAGRAQRAISHPIGGLQRRLA